MLLLSEGSVGETNSYVAASLSGQLSKESKKDNL